MLAEQEHDVNCFQECWSFSNWFSLVFYKCSQKRNNNQMGCSKKTIMSKINGIISYLLIFFVYFCSQGHSYSHQTFFNRPNYKGGFYKLCRGDF